MHYKCALAEFENERFGFFAPVSKFGASTYEVKGATSEFGTPKLYQKGAVSGFGIPTLHPKEAMAEFKEAIINKGTHYKCASAFGV